MKAAIAVAATLVAMASAAAQTSVAPLKGTAATTFADFENFGPHRAFAVGPDGSSSWRAGVGGEDPERAVTVALKECADRAKAPCTLHVVNNYTVTNHAWRELVPPRAVGAVDIGRLRPEPYWSMRGPQLAAGLVIWAHGYATDKYMTATAPQLWTGSFTKLGYDLYRFDREWIADWASDAAVLALAVGEARRMGYRRILLAGQSAGAWVSLAALSRGAAADGVIAIAAAHHGLVEKMTDRTRATSEWQYLVEGLKPGARIMMVNFAEDAYDVGGRMEVARAAFSRSGVEAAVVDAPAGFKGHLAGENLAFARAFGPCMQAFIVAGKRQLPCSSPSSGAGQSRP